MISQIHPSARQSLHPFEGHPGESDGPLNRRRGIVSRICAIASLFFKQIVRTLFGCIRPFLLFIQGLYQPRLPPQRHPIDFGALRIFVHPMHGGADSPYLGSPASEPVSPVNRDPIPYPSRLETKIDLYDDFPNNPVALLKHALRIHRGYLMAQDEAAAQSGSVAEKNKLEEFNESLESIDFRALIALTKTMIRAFVFTRKEIAQHAGGGIAIQAIPDFLKFDPIRLEVDGDFEEIEVVPFEKLKEMKAIWESLSDENKELFLAHFDTEITEIPFVGEQEQIDDAKRLWKDIDTMANNTLQGNYNFHRCLSSALTAVR